MRVVIDYHVRYSNSVIVEAESIVDAMNKFVARANDPAVIAHGVALGDPEVEIYGEWEAKALKDANFYPNLEDL